ncbi:MAG: SDR family oxidoreductase [Betaproteobacteria bacterium]
MLHPLSPRQRPELLIVGCGDIGLRVLQHLAGRWTVRVLTSSPERLPALRAAGALPLLGNLDDPRTLGRLGGLAGRVLHLAPPPGAGRTDSRTAHLLRALARSGRTTHLVYASTTGVYGDCGGEWVDESRALNPTTDRARRRVDAEARLRHFGRHSGCRVTILRIPGIYALDREGGDPRERLRRGTAVLQPVDDVYTNHIHADDLARACLRALMAGLPQRAVNVCDDSDLRMGDYFDLVADLWALPRPPRVSRDQASATLPPMMMSFMSESRRLRNDRMKRELGLVLDHPTVREGLAGGAR